MSISDYTVTIGASFKDHYMAYTFHTKGPADHNRMIRAICFYDTALFNSGLQRGLLLKKQKFDPKSPSGVLHAQMKRAYEDIDDMFCGQVEQCKIFSVVPKQAIISSDTPIITSLKKMPNGIDYGNIRCCEASLDGNEYCCRVFVNNGRSTFCPNCR